MIFRITRPENINIIILNITINHNLILELEVVEELEVVAAVAASDLVVEAVPAESSPSEDKAVSSEAESVPEPSKETNAKVFLRHLLSNHLLK